MLYSNCPGSLPGLRSMAAIDMTSSNTSRTIIMMESVMSELPFDPSSYFR